MLLATNTKGDISLFFEGGYFSVLIEIHSVQETAALS